MTGRWTELAELARWRGLGESGLIALRPLRREGESVLGEAAEVDGLGQASAA